MLSTSLFFAEYFFVKINCEIFLHERYFNLIYFLQLYNLTLSFFFYFWKILKNFSMTKFNNEWKMYVENLSYRKAHYVAYIFPSFISEMLLSAKRSFLFFFYLLHKDVPWREYNRVPAVIFKHLWSRYYASLRSRGSPTTRSNFTLARIIRRLEITFPTPDLNSKGSVAEEDIVVLYPSLDTRPARWMAVLSVPARKRIFNFRGIREHLFP